jgi:hypothetical protein
MILNVIKEIYPITYQITKAWHNKQIMKQDISRHQRKLMSEF